jgi:hypothetical protein
MRQPVVLFDLDGTLAVYDPMKSIIGEPITSMVTLAKQYIEHGYVVKIFTARASPYFKALLNPVRDPGILRDLYLTQITPVEEWCVKHIGQRLEVTCMKDFDVVGIFDDRAHRVVHNEGKVVGS